MLCRYIFVALLVKVTIGTVTVTQGPPSNVFANNIFTIKLISNKDETIKVSLSSTANLVGDLEKECKANNEIAFSDLSIQSGGSYSLLISSSEPNPITYPIEVDDAMQALDIIIPPGFSIDISGDITVTVYDTKGVLWTGAETVYLETDDNSFDKISVDLANSIATFTVTFKTDGTKTLQISTKSGTNKIAYASVGSSIMKYLVGPSSKILSTDSVQIKLQVYDTTGTIPKTDATSPVTLRLFCIGVCSSNLMSDYYVDNFKEYQVANSDNGQIYFPSFRVVASGQFRFEASCPDLPTAYSDSFTAFNKYKTMNFDYTPENVTANFNFELKIDLIGEDGFPSSISSTIFITEAQTSSVKGDLIVETNGKSAVANLYFTKYGLKTLTLTSALSTETYTCIIDVLPNTIYINPILDDEKPVNTRQTFYLDIEIKDWNSKMVETANGVHLLQFSLDPAGKLEGSQTSIETLNGIAHVYDLIPSEPGDYYLVITIDNDYEYTYDKEEFRIESPSCLPESGRISCMSLLMFLAIVLSILFYCMDKNVKNYPHLKFVPWLIHLFSSLFFTQPNKRRLLLCLSIFTCELIMLTVIGAVYAYYDSPLVHYERDFTDYYGRQLYKGGTGWALAQGGIIPVFFLAFFSIGRKDIAKICFWTCVALNFLCFGAIVGMTIKYCIGYSVYWTANFLIFILFDLIVMQPIYTAICYFLMTKKIRNKLYGKNGDKAEESGIPNDNQNAKEVKGFTDGNPDRNIE
ncbi:hypothetical protein SteCoe_16808 [Stentor coeruleus]|uniref:Intimal thickness related receptor IRP domain-containing protein n=1 Tax=Stentor coeruleus TaxID=5963 RepID=A0A1R2C0D0_9CILI|nr:hypothetical protein SteCoe_16808 [Stentor coeruleus]